MKINLLIMLMGLIHFIFQQVVEEWEIYLFGLFIKSQQMMLKNLTSQSSSIFPVLNIYKKSILTASYKICFDFNIVYWIYQMCVIHVQALIKQLMICVPVVHMQVIFILHDWLNTVIEKTEVERNINRLHTWSFSSYPLEC